ncbi:MAG TPA: RHS repeat-associated core domain-containing protein [Ktedonobacterales bacterium]|nr:RHS repeat-associated core domain-containing protein [Ktedonobacterales bacterium]
MSTRSCTCGGYTGQRTYGTTGLDYYHARYYDPVASQFTSADSQADGLNRYGYVGGNPTTATDPSGHKACSADFGKCSDGSGSDDDDTDTSDTPYIIGVDTDSTDVDGYYDDNGTYHYTTVIHNTYTWSDGHKTTQFLKIKKTTCNKTCHALRARKAALESMRQEAVAYAISGVIGEIIGGLAELAAVNSPIGWVRAGIAILTGGINLLSWLSNLIPGFAARAYGIIKVLSQVLAALHDVLAVLGMFALVDAVLKPVIAAAKGLPALLISIAFGIVGELIQMVAQSALARAAAIYAEMTRQGAMNIWDWCAGPGKGNQGCAG